MALARERQGEVTCRRAASILVLAGLCLLYGGSIAALAFDAVTDFPTFYLSARYAWEGKDIYSPVLADRADLLPGIRANAEPLNPNLNPPFQTLLLSPLGLMDYPTAFWCWSLLSVACGVGAALLVERGTRRPGASGWRRLTFVALAFAYFPTWASVVYGQFGLVLFFLLALAWVSARRGHDAVAGASLGLALSLKPFVAIFVLVFLLRRRWRLLTWFGATAAGCALAGLAAFGPQTHLDYVRLLGTTNWHAASWNASFIGFFGRIFGGSQNVPLVAAPLVGQVLAGAASLVALGWLSWLALARGEGADGRRFDLAYAFTVVAMLLLSPLGWMYYFPCLLLAAAVLWQAGAGPDAQRQRTLVLVAWAASTVPHLLVTSARFNDPLAWFTWAGVYFYALVLFAALLLWDSRRAAPRAESTPQGTRARLRPVA